MTLKRGVLADTIEGPLPCVPLGKEIPHGVYNQIILVVRFFSSLTNRAAVRALLESHLAVGVGWGSGEKAKVGCWDRTGGRASEQADYVTTSTGQ